MRFFKSIYYEIEEDVQREGGRETDEETFEAMDLYHDRSHIAFESFCKSD